ncbi:hypothetical protein [Desulfomarina profundi]|nr:hypothetical protein [Desulfomarina profundi]
MKLTDLPVFAIVGVDGEETILFTRWLLSSLEANNLETLVLVEGETGGNGTCILFRPGPMLFWLRGKQILIYRKSG